MARLLDLRLFEFDVLANDRVVLLQHELVRRALAVLRRRVEKAGIRRRHETDQFAAAFTFFRHGTSPGWVLWHGLPGIGKRHSPSSSTAVPPSVESRVVPGTSAGKTPGIVVVLR